MIHPHPVVGLHKPDYSMSGIESHLTLSLLFLLWTWRKNVREKYECGVLQVSGYSQLTSTCRESFNGFSFRFLGGSGLTVEEDTHLLFSWWGFGAKVVLASDPIFTFDQLWVHRVVTSLSTWLADMTLPYCWCSLWCLWKAATSFMADPERGSETLLPWTVRWALVGNYCVMLRRKFLETTRLSYLSYRWRTTLSEVKPPHCTHLRTELNLFAGDEVSDSPLVSFFWLFMASSTDLSRSSYSHIVSMLICSFIRSFYK